MAPITRSDVIETLGPLDDVVVTKIIDMGTTAAELAEAKAWITNDEAFWNSGRSPASGRVGHIVDLVASIDEEDEDSAPTS